MKKGLKSYSAKDLAWTEVEFNNFLKGCFKPKPIKTNIPMPKSITGIPVTIKITKDNHTSQC